MRKLALLLLIVFTVPAIAQVDYHKVKVTRWAGEGRPMTYEEYRALHPVQPLEWREVERRYSGLDQTGPLLVVVEGSIAPSLDFVISRYLDDLTTDGWDAILLNMTGGTPEDLRGILQQYWASDSIKGVTLIGDLPEAWFELYEDWDNDGLPDNPWQVQFTCDIYYMDLDGDWYDGDLDGVLDTHLGTWEPDIFVGQIIASPIGSQVNLITNYFDKNHAFRTGQLTLPGLGLAYIDDDWSGSAGMWGAALAQGCGLVEVVGDPDSTTAADYLDHLDESYYAILLAAHSNPELHTLAEQGGTLWTNVYYWQIAQTDPVSFFYNLFCCSGCAYNAPNYLGGQYLFADSYGLGVCGSTKTGSMLFFEDYYSHIENGECLGEALRLWLAQHGQEPGSIMWAMSWFYGMTHLGDATLFMQVGVEIASVEVIDDGSYGSSGDGDGIPDAGETVALSLELLNNEAQNQTGVWVNLSSISTFVDWLVDSVYVGTIPGQGMTTAGGFLFTVDPATPDATTLYVSAEIQNGLTGFWGDNFSLELRAPDLVLAEFDMTEISGNGDPYADPGETFALQVGVKNQGGDDSEPATMWLASLGPWVLPDSVHVTLPTLSAGETGTHDPAAEVIIQPGCPQNYAEAIRVTLEISGGSEENHYMLFPVGSEQTWADPITNPDEALVHYSVDEGYIDQWHVDDDRSISAPWAMKFGSYFSLNYAAHADGALETPLFRLDEVSELRFVHWIEAEDSFDGGIVEINTGDGWEAITPEGGYPGTSVSNGSYPGGPCYNGRINWSEAVFDLSGPGSFAKLRFRFGSDGGVQEEGWYVDDLQITTTGVAISPLSVTLTPVNPPIIIPASGGSFDYTIAAANNGSTPMTADIWCDVTLPNGTVFGPVLGPVVGFNFPGNWSTNRDRAQEVPAGAPSGTYSYNAYVGEYPDVVYHQDSFNFDKLGGDGSGDWADGWACLGEPFEAPSLEKQGATPSHFALNGVYPNPFNPVTTFKIELPAASWVRLEVFDINGRLCPSGSGPEGGLSSTTPTTEYFSAGTHEITFDGSGLASGVYVYRLQTSGSGPEGGLSSTTPTTLTGKMVLMK